MANDNDMVVRQVGLTFALLASPAKRDVAWVQANVDGYGGRTRDAAAHLIERDVRELRDLGVPARYQDGEVWVVKDLYELPPVDLTVEEASVIGLAADLSKPGSLGEFARSGWTKLAASGATRSMDAPALMSVSNDIFQLRPDTLRAIVKCVEAKQRISFDFVRAPGKEPERREVDPWGVVSLNNRAYFVGYDIDHDSPTERGRIFSFDVAGDRHEEFGGYQAIGSGSVFAKSSLKKLYRHDLDEASALAIAVEALYDAADDDSATGGPDIVRKIFPTAVVVSAEGAREVAPRARCSATESTLTTSPSISWIASLRCSPQ